MPKTTAETANLSPRDLATHLLDMARAELRLFAPFYTPEMLTRTVALFGAMRAELPHASARSEDLMAAAATAAVLSR
jgi:hypothetical protein